MNYHSLSEDDALKAIEYYREYFSEQGVYQNTLYQGIRELLEKLAPFFRVITGSNLDNTRTTKEDVPSLSQFLLMGEQVGVC